MLKKQSESTKSKTFFLSPLYATFSPAIFRHKFVNEVVRLAVFNQVLFLFVFLAHGVLFLSGYRMTTDQISLHFAVMHGIDQAICQAFQEAYKSGRICLFFPLPFFTEQWSEFFVMRAAFVLVYYVNFLVFAAYWERLTKSNAFMLMLLLFASLGILDGNNLPPNSYNIVFTLPLLFLLCIRYAVLNLSEDLSIISRKLWVFLILASFACYAASDYVLIFGASMFIMECFVVVIKTKGRNFFKIKILMCRNVFSLNLIPLAMAIIYYLSFRFLFPPQYKGTTLATDLDFLLIFKTAMTHAIGGISILRSDLYKANLMIDFMTSWDLFMASAVFLASSLSAGISLFSVRKFENGMIILMACLFLSIFVVIPLALTPKYQQLQLEGMKAYVDSRFAYLWVVAAFASAGCLLINFFGDGKRKIVISSLLGVIVGMSSVFAYCHNVDMCQVMTDRADVWNTARRIAMDPNVRTILDDCEVSQLVDPFSIVRVHAELNAENYWRKYMLWYRQQDSCFLDWNPRLFSSRPVYLKPNVVYKLPDLPVRFFGRNGWILINDRVAFSSGNRAIVSFQASHDSTEVVLACTSSAYLIPGETTKVAKILMNGKLIQTLSLSDEPTVSKISIHKNIQKDDIVSFEFILDNPSSPSDYGSHDERRLGFGLWNILLVQKL